MSVDGRYEDFYNWLTTLEKSSTLIDVDNLNGSKNGNTDTVSFKVRMYAYGLNID